MATFRLTPHQRRRLRAQLSTCHDARVFKRTLALLQLDRGVTAAEIGRLLLVSQPTVFNWRRRFLAQPSPKSLHERTGRGRPRLWTEELLQHLSQAMLQRPDRLGYASTDWTVPLLCEHLERTADQRLSDDTVRRQLHRMNYRFKRPRYVLIKDPLREKDVRPPSSSARGGRAEASAM